MQGFLAGHRIETAAQVDAKKRPLKERDALALVRGVDEIYATRGKLVVHLDLKKAKANRATLVAVLLGPSGNLRAPTLRVGRTLVVGFDEATYARLFA